jgi:hypothetical protein
MRHSSFHHSRQGLVKHWSNTGQMPVKCAAPLLVPPQPAGAGQTLVKHWANTPVLLTPQPAGAAAPAALLVKCWSNPPVKPANSKVVERWSNAGGAAAPAARMQELVKCWSNAVERWSNTGQMHGGKSAPTDVDESPHKFSVI